MCKKIVLMISCNFNKSISLVMLCYCLFENQNFFTQKSRPTSVERGGDYIGVMNSPSTFSTIYCDLCFFSLYCIAYNTYHFVANDYHKM